MGNQACVSTRDPNSQESRRNQSMVCIGSDNSVNSHSFKDTNSFPELPTLSDEVPLSRVPHYKEIQHIKIKASVAKKKKKEINSTYSIQNLHYRNQSLGSIKEQDESIDNYSSREIHYKNQPTSSTFRSDQTASKTARPCSSNSFSECHIQTNRRLKQNIFPIAIGTKDSSKAYSSINSQENTQRLADSFRDGTEIKSTRREKRIDIFHHKDSSCTFTNTQKIYIPNPSLDDRKPIPEVSDPINTYLKKFTEANNRGAHTRSASVGNRVSHTVFKGKLPCEIKTDNFPSLSSVEDLNNDNTTSKADNEVTFSPERNIFTFQASDSPQRRITSESTLPSEPNTNEASHFVIGAKRLSDYELINKMASLSLRRLITDGQGSKNLTSITEFDRVQMIEEEELLSRFSAHNIFYGKRNSTQGTINSARFKSNASTRGDLKRNGIFGKIPESARSDYSTISSIAFRMKKDPNDREGEMSIINYDNNLSDQPTQNQNRNCLKEIKNIENLMKAQKLERNCIGRISAVSECVQETDRSSDSLNRSGELSMMSPTNIESPDAVNLPLSQPHRTSPPNRDSLRQYVLSKNLKKNKKQEVDNMKESVKCGLLSYGKNSSDPIESLNNDLEHTNSTCSESLMPRESTKGFVIKYSSGEPEKIVCENLRNYSSVQEDARTSQYLSVAKNNMDYYREKLELGKTRIGKENNNQYNDRPYVRRFNSAIDYDRPLGIFGNKNN